LRCSTVRSGRAWVLPPEKGSCFPIDRRYAGSALRLSEIKLGLRIDRADAAELYPRATGRTACDTGPRYSVDLVNLATSMLNSTARKPKPNWRQILPCDGVDLGVVDRCCGRVASGREIEPTDYEAPALECGYGEETACLHVSQNVV
jgi:hypothetical protein